MRVSLKTIMAGPKGNHGIGDIIDIDRFLARQMVDAGYAVNIDPFPVEEPKVAAPKKEKATAKPTLETPEK